MTTIEWLGFPGAEQSYRTPLRRLCLRLSRPSLKLYLARAALVRVSVSRRSGGRWRWAGNVSLTTDRSTVGANERESKKVSMADFAIYWPFLCSKAVEHHERLTACGLTVLNFLSLASSRALFSNERCRAS